MKEDNIVFSIYSIRIGRGMFDAKTFLAIEADGKKYFPEDSEDILAIDTYHKEVIQDRFVVFDFEFREKYPYSSDVVDVKDKENIKKKDNPRDVSDLELKSQLFVLIDINEQRMYISNTKRKKYFVDFLKRVFDKKDVYAQPIISEEEFLENVGTINEICLTSEPGSLFSGVNTLSRHLKEDINYFQSDEIGLSMKYKDGISVKLIKEGLRKILNQKTSFRKLTVVGRKDNDFESVFNIGNVVSRFQIPWHSDKENKIKDPKQAFESLIDQIQKNEKETT
jgi:hypothetical protein